VTAYLALGRLIMNDIACFYLRFTSESHHAKTEVLKQDNSLRLVQKLETRFGGI
jgi:hypothetical protein